MTAEPTPTHRDPWVRAAALQAATRWLPVTDGEPALREMAERFARWIEGEGK